MNQRLIAEIGKSQRLRVVNRLKRTQGMSVNELSLALGMSYMGIKQHCVELQKLGYLDTWRRPKTEMQVGRPELIYRLTQKAHELFPVASNTMTLALLEEAGTLYGPAAASKLLFRVFQRKTDSYIAHVRGETLEERVRQFAALRDSDGYMSEVEPAAGGKKGWSIVEHHSPLADLLACYPALVARLEQELFGRVLRAPVKREQTTASGLYWCAFRIG